MTHAASNEHAHLNPEKHCHSVPAAIQACVSLMDGSLLLAIYHGVSIQSQGRKYVYVEIATRDGGVR